MVVHRLYFPRADAPLRWGQVLQVMICNYSPTPVFMVRALAYSLPVGELSEDTCAFACLSKPLVYKISFSSERQVIHLLIFFILCIVS